MGVSVWLELDRLMALPLDAVARATLARELLTLLSTDAVASNHVQLRDTLEMWLLEDELGRCRRLGQDGEWLEALQRMEALLPQLEQRDVGDTPVDVLLDLITGVYQAIVVEERVIASDERSELLWQSHRWLQRGGAVALPPHNWLVPIREQICRFGALAWLDHVKAIEAPDLQALARRRAQRLLIDLAPFWNPCPDWIAHYLLKELRSACGPTNRPFHPLYERVGWAQHLARLAPESSERERLEGLLWPALAAIEVGRALRLLAFSPPSVGS